jgi:hypothetical protein
MGRAAEQMRNRCLPQTIANLAPGRWENVGIKPEPASDDEGGETAIDPVSDPESTGIPLVPKPIVVLSQLVFASQAESAGAGVRRRNLHVDALAEFKSSRLRQGDLDRQDPGVDRTAGVRRTGATAHHGIRDLLDRPAPLRWTLPFRRDRH